MIQTAFNTRAMMGSGNEQWLLIVMDNHCMSYRRMKKMYITEELIPLRTEQLDKETAKKKYEVFITRGVYYLIYRWLYRS